MERTGESSSGLHLQTLRALAWGTKFQLSTLCLICLRSSPQHAHTCGHTVCDECVRRHGRPISGLYYSFRLQSCLVCCSSEPLTVRQVPPSAGHRVLTLDGGGVGGCISLEALAALQDRLGLPYPLQDEFDLAIGTSSGMSTLPKNEEIANESHAA